MFAFILTTCCFALWGFANDVTNPLAKVFKEVFQRVGIVRMPYVMTTGVVIGSLILFAITKMPTFSREEPDAPIRELAIFAIGFTLGAILLEGKAGLICPSTCR